MHVQHVVHIEMLLHNLPVKDIHDRKMPAGAREIGRRKKMKFTKANDRHVTGSSKY